tara:strand:- start:866 stop:1615 length:750 start_codon:yes stop_codon:yes gene_type:complete
MIVYTCLTGNHPIIPEQKQFESGIEYIFFHTHDIKNKHGEWQFKQIPIDKNELYTQRKHKILSHQLFDNPHAYFDTNVVLKPNLKIKIEECIKVEDYSVGLHPLRNSYLDECCFSLFKGIEIDVLIEITQHLKNLGYDFSKHVCMLGGFIIRNNTDKVKKINTMWWDLWKKFEKRDQILFPACIYLNKTKFGTFPVEALADYSKEYYGFWKRPSMNNKTDLLPRLIKEVNKITELENMVSKEVIRHALG